MQFNESGTSTNLIDIFEFNHLSLLIKHFLIERGLKASSIGFKYIHQIIYWNCITYDKNESNKFMELKDYYNLFKNDLNCEIKIYRNVITKALTLIHSKFNKNNFNGQDLLEKLITDFLYIQYIKQ